MNVVWGVVLVALALLAWGGQTISWLAPTTAAKWNLAEAEDNVEPVYWRDIRGEAPWDFLTLWPLLVAGVLLILDEPSWAYFGLGGGAMYVYFAGRGVFTRRSLERRGFRVGAPLNLKLGYVMLTTWGVTGLITIFAAVVALPT